jgi:hypothetical protein
LAVRAPPDLADDVRQSPLIVDRQPAPLVELSETLGCHCPKEGQFLLVLTGPLFEQMETGPHHLAGVAKPSSAHLFLDKPVEVFGQIDIARGHLRFLANSANERSKPLLQECRKLAVFSTLIESAAVAIFHPSCSMVQLEFRLEAARTASRRNSNEMIDSSGMDR